MKHHAAELRHEPTPAETSLWVHLRAHRANGIHFRRQFAIGKYIVDFCLRQYRRYRCVPRPKLIVEVDGSPHLSQQGEDDIRTIFLESKGYRVLLFWNEEVLQNIEKVMSVILDAISG